MTLHYAPTTPEEEELALALALSASLSSAGEAVCKPARSVRASDPGKSARANDCAIERDQHRRATGPRTSSGTTALPSNLSLSLTPSLIYPQLPPPPARGNPSPAASSRPAPAASASANALLQEQQPAASGAPRHGASSSPPRARARWDLSGATSSSGRSFLPQPAAASDPQRGPSPGRPVWPPAQQYPPVYTHQQPQHPPPRHYPSQPHLPPIAPPPLPAPIPRSKSAAGSSGMFNGGDGARAGGSSCSGGIGDGTRRSAGAPSAAGGGGPVSPRTAAPPVPPQLFSDPEACAGCGRGFGLFTRIWVTGMDRKWHPECFKCGFCQGPISNGRGAYSYQIHPGDPLPYHRDCYRHVHHPICHVCGTHVAEGPNGVISYRENGFWRERYCAGHSEAELRRCCACSRLQKQGEEWAPLPDGRPLCLQCLSSVVLDTPDGQPLYDEVLAFYAHEMRLPHAYKPPLLLVDGHTLNTHAEAEGRDDTAGAPVFHVRGLCVAHVYSHIPTILRGAGGTVRSIATEVLNVGAFGSGGGGRGPRVHCKVKVLLLLYGLPRLLSGSIMAHELMHAWLRMEGVVGLSEKVEEGLCQLLACLWLDRQHELLRGKLEEQRLASFFAYQIRTDTSEVYGEGFREAMEAFQSIGLTAMIQNVKRFGRYTPP